MANSSAARYKFIGHALRGDGPFRPVLSYDGVGSAAQSGTSYLVRYPRESVEKFQRRNEIAFFASPLALACSRFVGYLTSKSPTRELPNPLYTAIAKDTDGRGNTIDVFLSQFSVQAKARGAMLMLVDMPQAVAANRAQQLAMRAVPFWSSIAPEDVTDYELGEDGKFVFVSFRGEYTTPEDTRKPCTWRFDREAWAILDDDEEPIATATHPLGECPVLLFTEGESFPHFGPFSVIADLSRRLFNADSELDEILRSQTFSLLTMQVPDDSTAEQKLGAAQVAGQTIGTSNLLVHSGSTPAFIAPPDGPARLYLDRIKDLRAQIDQVALNVVTDNPQESGIARQMRFAAVNGELAYFSQRLEDFERRAWALSQKWLAMTQPAAVNWPRDFDLADVEQELRILSEMQANAMPAPVIAAQQRRIVAVQFAGLDAPLLDQIHQAIDERTLEGATNGV
jgi:hypothetical protein